MSTQNLTDDVKKRSAWSIAMGVLTAVLGVFLILYPFATAMITTVLLGWILILVGIAQFVFALHTQTVGNFFLKILLGILYAIAGIALAFLPIEGVIVLTGVLGTLLLIQAGMLTVTAFQMKPLDGWGWYLADAIASLLLGISDLRKVAQQLYVGNRHASRRCRTCGRHLQDHDCRKDPEWCRTAWTICWRTSLVPRTDPRLRATKDLRAASSRAVQSVSRSARGSHGSDRTTRNPSIGTQHTE